MSEPPLLPSPGLIALLGSGETAASGGNVFQLLAQQLAPPLRIAILETPAGFQPNSAQVAAQIADFLAQRLGQYRPSITVVAARARHSAWSPDDPALVAPLLRANLIVIGPGSPSYAVRHLHGSLAWQVVLARHQLGAALVLASAGALACGAWSVPIYEIYKAGAPVSWQPGLNLCAAYGLELAIIPHWNNRDGGATIDTSRCFLGQQRFARLQTWLPGSASVVGIDEHSAVLIDPAQELGCVLGQGNLHLLHAGAQTAFPAGSRFPLTRLGQWQSPDRPWGVAATAWQQATAAPLPLLVSQAVLALVAARQQARLAGDWASADELRQQVRRLGWQIRDTAQGPQLQPRAFEGD